MPAISSLYWYVDCVFWCPIQESDLIINNMLNSVLIFAHAALKLINKIELQTISMQSLNMAIIVVKYTGILLKGTADY